MPRFIITLLLSSFILHSPFLIQHLHAASVQLPQTGQKACYDASGATINCAGTGQDGDKQVGTAWPSPRFTDKGNGTVTDNLTGLIWLKNANCFGSQTWASAMSSAAGLKSGSCGLTDGSVAGQWVLPNRKELLSLVDWSNSDPALPSGHPFTAVQSGTYSGYYWSSTTSSGGTDSAWFVLMSMGYMHNYYKTTSWYVWPVRIGQ